MHHEDHKDNQLTRNLSIYGVELGYSRTLKNPGRHWNLGIALCNVKKKLPLSKLSQIKIFWQHLQLLSFHKLHISRIFSVVPWKSMLLYCYNLHGRRLYSMNFVTRAYGGDCRSLSVVA